MAKFVVVRVSIFIISVTFSVPDNNNLLLLNGSLAGGVLNFRLI